MWTGLDLSWRWLDMKKKLVKDCTLTSVVLSMAVALTASAAKAQYHDPVRLDAPTSCTIPANQRRQEDGCYVTAITVLKTLPKGPLFWHIYTYPTREAAEQAKGDSTATIVNSLGKIWLFKIAPADWRSTSGQRVAIVGPLPGFDAKEYEARYLESISGAGPAHTPIHRHPGVEAWYVLSGAQCMQTPEKTFLIRDKETGLVPAGAPMMLTRIKGPERALVLVLQDDSQPWMTKANDWKPTTACPQ